MKFVTLNVLAYISGIIDSIKETVWIYYLCTFTNYVKKLLV